jgi:hypothetical protein
MRMYWDAMLMQEMQCVCHIIYCECDALQRVCDRVQVINREYDRPVVIPQ